MKKTLVNLKAMVSPLVKTEEIHLKGGFIEVPAYSPTNPLAKSKNKQNDVCNCGICINNAPTILCGGTTTTSIPIVTSLRV